MRVLCVCVAPYHSLVSMFVVGGGEALGLGEWAGWVAYRKTIYYLCCVVSLHMYERAYY